MFASEAAESRLVSAAMRVLIAAGGTAGHVVPALAVRVWGLVALQGALLAG